MQKRFSIIMLVIMAAVGTAPFLMSEKGSDITNYPPKNEKIVAFGDSLISGYGSTEGGDFVSLLERRLGRPVKNMGRSGDTTADGLARIDEVLKEDAGTVILLLGGNDYLRRNSEAVTRENLSAIIERLQERGAVVVLLGVRSGIFIDGREEMYLELSRTYGTVYLEDVLDGVFSKPDLMFDGIHPNDRGYAIIAERVFALFEKNDL